MSKIKVPAPSVTYQRLVNQTQAGTPTASASTCT